MAWEVALAVGGSLTAVAIVVIVVMLVAMCTVSKHHCKHELCSLIEYFTIKFTEGPPT